MKNEKRKKITIKSALSMKRQAGEGCFDMNDILKKAEIRRWGKPTA